MSDIDQGTDTDQPADDIRSLLGDAFEQAESGTASTETPVVDKGAAKTDGDDASGTRERGPDGKFLKKDETSPAAKTTAKTAAKPDKAATDPADKTAPVTDDAAKTAATAADGKEPPAHWSQADKDKFKAQPPEAQAFIMDRFKAMEGDYTRKTQATAHLQKEYGKVDEMFAPHREAMRQKGFTPSGLIEAWANVEQKLAGGPDSAIEVIKGLVRGYNLPVQKLATALGITPQAAAQQPQGDQQQPTAVQDGKVVAVPPEVAAELKAVREQLGQFGQRFQTIDQQNANARRAQEIEQETAVTNQVNEFKSAVDEKGSPKHPHFEEVEAMMTSLAQAALASKQPVPSLDQLYETAVYANPSTRDKVLTAQRQQEEAKRTEEARAKAASARKAGSSVTGAPGTGQAPSGRQASELSLREQLEAAADDAA
jgi:hypothetical protein